jgi:hypothetical protein
MAKNYKKEEFIKALRDGSIIVEDANDGDGLQLADEAGVVYDEFSLGDLTEIIALYYEKFSAAQRFTPLHEDD